MTAITIKDIAIAAQVSTATVSRALAGNSRQNKETINRIQEIATQLGYVPNVQARRLVSQRSEQIGFVIPSLSKHDQPLSLPIVHRTLGGVIYRAQELNYMCTVLGGKEHGSTQLLSLLDEQAVDGLIIIACEDTRALLTEIAASTAAHHKRVICIGHASDAAGLRCIDSDMLSCLPALTSVCNTSTRAYFLNGSQHSSDARYRQQCFEHICEKNSITISKSWTGDFTEQSGYAAGQDFLTSDADCICCASDFMALGLWRFLQEHNDNRKRTWLVHNEEGSLLHAMHGHMHSICEPRAAMGAAAVDTLLDHLYSQNADIPIPTLSYTIEGTYSS